MRLLLVLALITAIPAGAGEVPKDAAEGWIDANSATLSKLNREIWSLAEIGLQETRSAEALISFLEANGFEVERGVAGMPTAFVASWGSGQPVVGILAEYDALPGLSQDAVPERRERPDASAGHGCGHSVFGTASAAAAVAAKVALEDSGRSGTIKLFGTPAEETGLGKIYMLREDVFEGVDALLAWHASDETRSSFAYSKALVSAKFRFSGLPAHASVSPHDGRSALDAVELMNVGANFLREHVKPDARIHYVITDGGGQPNVVPPEAEVWYYVRADKHTDVERYFARLQDVARGAALMTATTLEAVQVDTDLHEVLPNRPLSEAIHANLERVGAPRFSEEEKAFARKTQQDMVPLPAEPLSEAIEPLEDEPGQSPGSTDVGDLSWFFPTAQLTAATHTLGAPGHSWQIVACTGMSIGEKGMVVAAKVLADTALDLAWDGELLERSRQDLKRMREGLDYVTLIPEGQRAPTSIR